MTWNFDSLIIFEKDNPFVLIKLKHLSDFIMFCIKIKTEEELERALQTTNKCTLILLLILYKLDILFTYYLGSQIANNSQIIKQGPKCSGHTTYFLVGSTFLKKQLLSFKNKLSTFKFKRNVLSTL